MAPSPAPTPARAPAPEARLLAALDAGDRQAALQWAERVVHRRGVDGLRQWLQHTLLPRQGAAAVTWLEEGLGLIPATLAASAPDPVSAAPRGELPLSVPAVAVNQPAPAPASLRRLRSWLVDLPQAS